MTEPRTIPVLNDTALMWANRALWAASIAVYLTAFVGGIVSHGDELFVMARAIGLTLATAVLGNIGVGVLARASLPVEEEEGPSAEEDGPIGSLVEPAPSTNVAQQEDGAEAA